MVEMKTQKQQTVDSQTLHTPLEKRWEEYTPKYLQWHHIEIKLGAIFNYFYN